MTSTPIPPFLASKPIVQLAARRGDISSGKLTVRDPRDFVIFSRSKYNVDSSSKAGGTWRWNGAAVQHYKTISAKKAKYPLPAEKVGGKKQNEQEKGQRREDKGGERSEEETKEILVLRPYNRFKTLPSLDWPSGHCLVTTDLISTSSDSAAREREI